MTEIAVSAGIKVNTCTVTFGILQPVPVPIPVPRTVRCKKPARILVHRNTPRIRTSLLQHRLRVLRLLRLRLLWVTCPQLAPRSTSLANGDESLFVPKHRRHLDCDPTTAVSIVKILVGCSHACRSLLHMDSWSRLIIPGVILMISHAATEE